MSAPGQEPEGEMVAGGWWRIAAVGLAVAALGIFGGLPLLVVVLAVLIMIFMHELGHYLTAKWAGMKVTEFFIGFGPRIWSFQRGETEYGLKGIPLGAYVKIIGMNNLDEVDPAEESRTYRQKSYGRRLSVAVAGSTMHFLMALVLLFVFLVGFGRTDEEAWSVRELSSADHVQELVDPSIEENQALLESFAAGESPAEQAGLQPGDRIVEIDGTAVSTFSEAGDIIAARPGEEIDLVILRDGEEIPASTTVGTISDGTDEAGFIGFRADEEEVRLGVLEAVPETFRMFGELVKQSVLGIANLFTPDGLSNVFENAAETGGSDAADEPPPLPGPSARENPDEGRVLSIVGAVRLGAEGTAQSLGFLFVFLALLNVFIGVFNLIPLLPFDGGHVAIATYEKIRELASGQRRYMADVSKLLPLTYGVVMVMIALAALTILPDIFNPPEL